MNRTTAPRAVLFSLLGIVVLLLTALCSFAQSPSSAGSAAVSQQNLSASSPGASLPPSSQQKAKASKADGEYVGSDTCMGCHDDQYRRFKNTVMGKAMLENPHTPEEARGCESCHSPGRAHVDAGGGKGTIPIRFGKDSPNNVAEQNAVCIDCHNRGTHMFWKGSPHESRGLACVDCHQVKQGVHISVSSDTRYSQPLTDNRGVKLRQPELCLQCHQMRRAQLQRSSHMPYREGKVV